MKGKGDEEGRKGRKRRRKKDEEGGTERLAADYLAARWWHARSPQSTPSSGAGDSGAGLRVTSSRRAASPPAASRVPALCNRVALVLGPTGGSRSPWVAASPLVFGFLPGQPRWRQEDDNCSETQHLIWAGCARRAGGRAPGSGSHASAARHARGGEGRTGGPGGRLRVFPLEQPPPSSGKRSRVIA